MFKEVTAVMHSLAGAMRCRRYKRKDLEELTVALAKVVEAAKAKYEV